MTDAYYLDEPRPGPEGYDPDWDDLVPFYMRSFSSRFASHAMFYGFQSQPISMRQYTALFGSSDRIIARTPIIGLREIAEVSTVWLGLDHRFGRNGDPVIFESMVFGGPLDQEMQRYSYWHEALAGHAELVQVTELDLFAVQPLRRTNRRGNHPLDDVAREFGIDLNEDDE